MKETTLHIAIMDYLNAVLPADIRAFTFHQNPRNKVEGAKLKRMGMKAGLADIGLIRAGGYIALIEVKTDKGRLSPAQVELRDWCGEYAVPYCVVRSIGDVQAFLTDMNIQTRGRLAA